MAAPSINEIPSDDERPILEGESSGSDVSTIEYVPLAIGPAIDPMQVDPQVKMAMDIDRPGFDEPSFGAVLELRTIEGRLRITLLYEDAFWWTFEELTMTERMEVIRFAEAKFGQEPEKLERFFGGREIKAHPRERFPAGVGIYDIDDMAICRGMVYVNVRLQVVRGAEVLMDESAFAHVLECAKTMDWEEFFGHPLLQRH